MFIKDDKLTRLTFDLYSGEVQAVDCYVSKTEEKAKPPVMLVRLTKTNESLGWFAITDIIDDLNRFVVCDVEQEAQRLHTSVCDLLIRNMKRNKMALEIDILKIVNQLKSVQVDRNQKVRLRK